MKTLILSLSLILCSCELLENATRTITKPSYSQDEIVKGLKEALDVGVDIMADSAGMSNGYWSRSEAEGYAKAKAIQILLPEDAQEALTVVQGLSSDFNQWRSDLSDNTFGISDLIINSLDYEFINDVSLMENLQDSIWKSLNRAAEDAAPASKDLFVQAITDMTLEDGSNILFSDDSSAATQYLEGATYSGLVDIFEPIVDQSMNKVKANQLWTQYSSLYNNYITQYQELTSSVNSNSLVPQSFKNTLSLPSSFPDSLNPSLANYTTTQALNGLFNLISQEEYRIRQDPFQYANALIEEIFTLIEDEIELLD